MMPRLSVLAYAALCCVVFILSALYFSAFLLTNGRAVNSLDSGWAAAVDVALVAAFGAVHSVMARAWFKRVWTRVVPPSAERATYVLQSSLFLALIAWQWQPIDGVIWRLDGPAAWVVTAVFLTGAGMTVASMLQLGHMEFLGIRQAWDNFNARPDRPAVFRTPLLYRMVRHPLQLGLLVMFFATPHMSTDHLLLAVSMAGYIAIGLRFEEHALLREFGAAYEDYKKKVPMILPRWRWRQTSSDTPPSGADPEQDRKMTRLIDHAS